MQISSRFTIASHILVYVATYHREEKITSDVLAQSIQVNPVIIRNILGQLKKAGLIAVKRGQGGVSILPSYEDLSLLAVYQAVESVKNQELFSFHDNPNPACPVGRSIHSLLDDRLLAAQRAMEAELAQVSLADLLAQEMV
ncbi:Rrf2 family transcriptional regulator [Streptococcus cuniculipharyngis]|uniref:Rrf2 family transcriptional regulator n=1 Tax=Streptococcus cuniculipharyngis TaxID=1562651 RepID=A0A5C5SEI7_9STRE|nr:Rrf2 family transcriptional regulator [Streptococcus cuniculipharyngis]TWS98191.1 Rrf2 family transcriptional regulator [Streptococcus cuniculipharyngis]